MSSCCLLSIDAQQAASSSDTFPAHCYMRSAEYQLFKEFLRATAVPAGTAEARISYGNSVCLSVCHDPVVYQAQVR